MTGSSRFLQISLLGLAFALFSGPSHAAPPQAEPAVPTAAPGPAAPTHVAPPLAQVQTPKPNRAPDWVTKKPDASTQTQKKPEEREGVNPCMSEDPGFGIYDHWNRAPSMGQILMPQQGGTTSDGRFDVMFHFHGHDPIRKEWVRVMDGAMLVGIDLGIGSGSYSAAFASPATFEQLVHSVEKAVADKTGKKNARVRKVGLSAWSAGYGAVGTLLDQRYARDLVDTVVLLDGLHCGYDADSLNDLQMKPFLDFAREAKAKNKLMFVSHSSIIPPGYASTTETANFLIYQLGGRPTKAAQRSSDPWGLELISKYNSGNFYVRGYRGNDKMDHCAHIGLFRDVLRVHVKRRWNSPVGRAKKTAT